ncbi:MAG: hypothetical protein HY043_13880 [Verrucomicrobia bacterium]|nr:hypothetical protein [Verrucomicrobiota bacterium]
MKISLALGPRRKLDRATAWACVLANQCALPGSGTLTAGRRIGFAQTALALVGFGPMILLSLRVLVAAYHFQQAADEFSSFGEIIDEVSLRLRHIPQTWGLYFWIGAPGLCLFALGWFWALTSSIAILAEAYSTPRLPPFLR